MSPQRLSKLRDAAVFATSMACAFAAASIDDPAPAVALTPCCGIDTAAHFAQPEPHHEDER